MKFEKWKENLPFDVVAAAGLDVLRLEVFRLVEAVPFTMDLNRLVQTVPKSDPSRPTTAEDTDTNHQRQKPFCHLYFAFSKRLKSVLLKRFPSNNDAFESQSLVRQSTAIATLSRFPSMSSTNECKYTVSRYRSLGHCFQVFKCKLKVAKLLQKVAVVKADCLQTPSRTTTRHSSDLFTATICTDLSI